jgi:hypothetical protein
MRALPLSRRPRIVYSASTRQARFQVWYHPAGVVAQVDQFSLSPVQQPSDWSVNTVKLSALVQAPLARASVPGCVLAAAKLVETVSWCSLTRPLAMFWSDLQSRQQAGSMLSFPQWAACLSDPFNSPEALSSLLPLRDSCPEWLELGLDWANASFTSTSTQIPHQQERLKSRAIVRHAKALTIAAQEQSAAAPLGLSFLLVRALDHAVYRKDALGFARHTPAKLRVLRQEFKRNVALEKGLELIRFSPGSSEVLLPEQATVLADWSTQLASSTNVSRLRLRRLPDAMPGLPEVRVLDLALQVAHLPGALDKVYDMVQRASDDQLRAWCQGEGIARPLALAVASAQLEIQNRGYLEREVQQVSEDCLKILDVVRTRLGGQALVWDDARGNVWGEAIGRHMHLPIDEDLVLVQHARTHAFLQWVMEHDIAVPDVVRWRPITSAQDPDPKNSSPVLEASLMSTESFVHAWMGNQAGSVPPIVLAHWDLLAPVSSLFKRKALALNVCEQSPERSRPRSL